ncbi:MAG: hypothetical protein WAU58_01830 [Terriglobales bacterium]
MCSITLVVQDVTMATTELMCGTRYHVCWARKEEDRLEFRPPRMNWVVVTDENHYRRMQMNRAAPSEADR